MKKENKINKMSDSVKNLQFSGRSTAINNTAPSNLHPNTKMNRAEREMFRTACSLEGVMQKKSSSALVGWQNRYFKVIANGCYLVYYDKTN